MTAPVAMTKAEKDKLILDHLWVAKSVAKYYIRRTPKLRRLCLEEDLCQEGAIGIILAANKYDPNRGASFGTLAWLWARAMMRPYIVKMVNGVKPPRERNYGKIGVEIPVLSYEEAVENDECGDGALDLPGSYKSGGTVLGLGRLALAAMDDAEESMDAGLIADVVSVELDRIADEIGPGRQGRRAVEIYVESAFGDGEENGNIARRHGLSRERVRQIVTKVAELIEPFFESLRKEHRLLTNK